MIGTWRLVRLALRRDRILLPVWLAAIGGLAAAVVASIAALYVDEQERVAAATFSAANTVARIFDGPASGTELGALAMVEAYVVLAILVALMSSQMVVRHTRQDEETGRAELLEAAVVGRHARLSAALIVAVAANLVLAALVALVLLGQDLGLAGSVAGGLALAGVGIGFAGIAAVTAQLAETQRAANGLAALALGVAFSLRAVGDAFGEVGPSGVEVVSAWPSWLSPIGWGQQVRPFHQDNWDVFALFAALFVVLVAVAFRLTSHRDVGTGMLRSRLGPPVAAARLGTPLGLAWRLQRGGLWGWLAGLLVVGTAFGAVGEGVDDVAGISEQLEELIRQMAASGELVDLYFALAMGLLGVAVAAFAVQALLRMRGEEASGRLEPVLATAVPRRVWLASHVTVAAGGAVGLLAAMGAGGAAGYWAVTGDLATGLGFLAAALAQIPAVFALGGFVIAVFAVAPRWVTAVAWAAVAVSLVMGQLGAILELPQAVLNVSPFTHVPPVPAEPFTWTPVLALLGTAIALGGVGFVVFARRDLDTTA
jgi:ABC-2 type transport system permease protein